MPILLTSTAQIEERVQIFEILGTLFTIMAVIFLIVSIALFIIFDIRTVIGEKTGRIAKKSIEEMERSTAQGRGRSSRRSRKSEADSGYSGQMHAVDELFDAATVDTGSGSAAALDSGQRATAVLDDGQSSTTVLDDGQSNTTVLSEGQSDTTVLNGGQNDTTVLSQVHYEGPDDAPTAVLEEDRKVKIGKFEIIKNIMLIHTDEYI